MNHVLSLEAPDTLNACILRILDTSIYVSTIPVICPTLNITLPGFNHSIQLDNQVQGFSLNLTGCDLGVQTTDCGTSYVNLPDGIYILKYSVSPNTIVYAEYNHLRITLQLKKYYKVLCSLELSGCEPSADVKKQLHELRIIKDMLDAAKAQVEFCHDPKKGMQIFNYACKRLDKIVCTICI